MVMSLRNSGYRLLSARRPDFLDRALQHHPAVVGQNHLHCGDLINRRRNAASWRCSVTRDRHPSRQPRLATVATHHDQRHRVVVGIHRSRTHELQCDVCSPLLAAERHRRRQQGCPDLRHGQRRRGRLRRRGGRRTARNADQHTDRQHYGRGGRGRPGHQAGSGGATARWPAAMAAALAISRVPRMCCRTR